MHKTQKQISQLLGTSLKAIHSYEQGWRTIPVHAERQLLFLAAMKNRAANGKKYCWSINKCPSDQKEHCPAWEFHTGDLCWFISGTICNGQIFSSWNDKMKICRKCTVFKDLFAQK